VTVPLAVGSASLVQFSFIESSPRLDQMESPGGVRGVRGPHTAPRELWDLITADPAVVRRSPRLAFRGPAGHPRPSPCPGYCRPCRTSDQTSPHRGPESIRSQAGPWGARKVEGEKCHGFCCPPRYGNSEVASGLLRAFQESPF